MKTAIILPPRLKNYAPSSMTWFSINKSTHNISSYEFDKIYTKYKISEEIPPMRPPKQGLHPVLVNYFYSYLSSRLIFDYTTDRSATDGIQLFSDFDERDRYLRESTNQYFVDLSLLGAGKTFWSSKITGASLGCDRVIWLQKQKYNLSVEGLESFVPMPVKHRGLVLDQSLKTHDGKPVLRNAKHGEKPEIEPNCINPSIPCYVCPHKSECSTGSHRKYTALYDINHTIKGSDRIIAHPNSLPKIKLKSTDLVIIDEASELLELTKQIAIDARFWQEHSMMIYRCGDELKHPFEAAVETEDIELAMSLSAAYLEDPENQTILALTDSTNYMAIATKLLETMKVLGEEGARYCPINKKVTAKNTALFNELNRAKKILMLDATFDHQTFDMLGLNVQRVAVGRNNTPCNGNVTIYPVEGLPNITKQSPKEDVIKIENFRKTLPKDVGCIATKRLEKVNDIVYGRDSCGSNKFQNHNHIALLSLYRIDLMTAQNEFACLYAPLNCKNAPQAFQEYYDGRFQSDTLQALGRIRFTRRPTENLKATIVTKGKWMLNWLQPLGFRFEGQLITNLTNNEEVTFINDSFNNCITSTSG